MPNVSIKSAAPFDVEQIVTLIETSEAYQSPSKLTANQLDNALFGHGRSVKALVAREQMQVIGCLFYQVTFSVKECAYLVHEVSCHVHPHAESAAAIRNLMRRHLSELDLGLKCSRDVFSTLSKSEAVS